VRRCTCRRNGYAVSPPQERLTPQCATMGSQKWPADGRSASGWTSRAGCQWSTRSHLTACARTTQLCERHRISRCRCRSRPPGSSTTFSAVAQARISYRKLC